MTTIFLLEHESWSYTLSPVGYSSIKAHNIGSQLYAMLAEAVENSVSTENSTVLPRLLDRETSHVVTESFKGSIIVVHHNVAHGDNVVKQDNLFARFGDKGDFQKFRMHDILGTAHKPNAPFAFTTETNWIHWYRRNCMPHLVHFRLDSPGSF
jgi:hypothetical protein